MGKITLVVEGTTVGTVAGGGGIAIPYEVSETDSARLIAAMAAFYKGKFVRPVDGSDPPRVEPYQPQIGDVVREWFNDIVRTALRQTLDYEKSKAAVPPITVAGL